LWSDEASKHIEICCRNYCRLNIIEKEVFKKFKNGVAIGDRAITGRKRLIKCGLVE
jgi:hypothetical protein